MPQTILIGSLLREHGPTGLQTHARLFKAYLEARNQPVEFLSPFSAPRAAALPVLAVGRLVLDKLDRRLGTWWHRYWRGVLMQVVLRSRLRRGGDVVVYAQCPVVAAAA